MLKNAVKCIAELITVNYDQNIDFNDIQTIMKNSGPAMLGLATASGENRVEKVVDDALACPLLNESVISEVGNFLFFIRYGSSNKLKISFLLDMASRTNSLMAVGLIPCFSNRFIYFFFFIVKKYNRQQTKERC